MSWPSFLWRNDENTRHAWGYTFQWSPEHWSEQQMEPMKYTYDVLAEECLTRLDEISPPHDSQLPRNQSRVPEKEGTPPKRDLYELLKQYSTTDEKLNELWTEVNTIPDWVDWDQIARGQDVFYRYGGAALTGLAYQSLLGGMGANRVVETLARTGGFGVKVARHRMYETTQHILQVTKSLDSIKPGGEGHASTIRVRLLHAAVRRRILKLAKERPDYYDIDKFGIPINELDSIATIVTFSGTLIWVSFPRQGITMRPQEILDYLALWRLVAHYIGTPPEIFASPSKTKAVMESLMLYEISPSETSKLLANNVINSLAGRPPAYASREFLSASARWLNGRELSDALALPNPSFYYTLLMLGQCLFFNILIRINRAIPSWDARQIKRVRHIFWAVIVDKKMHGLGEETSFDFKYIPEFGTMTQLEEYAVGEEKFGVERRNLRTLLLTGFGFTVAVVVSWRIVSWSVGGALRLFNA